MVLILKQHLIVLMVEKRQFLHWQCCVIINWPHQIQTQIIKIQVKPDNSLR